MAGQRDGGGAGRLALILAIVALLVAVAAYRREGGELKTLWRDLTGGAGGRVRITEGADGDFSTWLAHAKERLERRRPEVAGGHNLEQAHDDVADLRAKLARAYRNSGAAAKEQGKSVDADLERLEAQLKEKSDKALAELDATLAKIKEEMGKEKEEH
jgi:hypothetical protein